MWRELPLYGAGWNRDWWAGGANGAHFSGRLLVPAHAGHVAIRLRLENNKITVDDPPRATAGEVVIFRAGDAAGDVLSAYPWAALSTEFRYPAAQPDGWAVTVPDHDLEDGHWDRRGVPRLPERAEWAEPEPSGPAAWDIPDRRGARPRQADAGYFEPLRPAARARRPASLGPGAATQPDAALGLAYAVPGARARRLRDAVECRQCERLHRSRAVPVGRAEAIWQIDRIDPGWHSHAQHGQYGWRPLTVRDRRREWAADVVFRN
jgi:hypothetical protein